MPRNLHLTRGTMMEPLYICVLDLCREAQRCDHASLVQGDKPSLFRLSLLWLKPACWFHRRPAVIQIPIDTGNASVGNKPSSLSCPPVSVIVPLRRIQVAVCVCVCVCATLISFSIFLFPTPTLFFYPPFSFYRRCIHLSRPLCRTSVIRFAIPPRGTGISLDGNSRPSNGKA